MRNILSRHKTTLKIVVSTALMAYLINKISIGEFVHLVAAIDPGVFAAGVGCFFISNLMGAYQWHQLLGASGVSLTFKQTFRFYFVGLFFNNFLPANVGGDAWKIVDLGRQERRALGVFCATLLDRLIGLGSLAFLALLVYAVCTLAGIPLPATALFLVPVLLVITMVMAFLLSRRIGRHLPSLFLQRIDIVSLV